MKKNLLFFSPKKYLANELCANFKFLINNNSKQMKGSSSDMEQRQAQNEEQEKARIEEQTAANKQAVVDRIIELVCSVQPKLHVNFKPTQAA